MNENNNNNTTNNNARYDFVNSKALFVLKIITMSFAILAFVVVTTVMLTKWIVDLNRSIKESSSKIAKATVRLNKFRRDRIKHILKQRKLQLKEEKAGRKNSKEQSPEVTEDYSDDDVEDLTDDEKDIDKFDNELRDIILDAADDEEI